MASILITNDCDGWAIGNLTNSIIKNNPRFNWYKVVVHPRGVAQGYMEIKRLLDSGVKIDLWHAQYWNSALKLLEMTSDLDDIPKFLTHHNHHCLNKSEWKPFTALNEMTDWGCNELGKIHPNVIKIPHGIDLDKYSYIEDHNPEEPRVGYGGRVVPWKNLKEMCEVSKELGYRVIGCGYVDKPDYWDTVPKDNLDFHGGMGRGAMMPANFQAELYRKMTCYVMYSTEEKESGTLGLLEAMARGVPVMATEQGMARDIIKDGENGIIFTPENFQARLKMVMEDKELREKLRKNAWKTIMKYSEKKMARDYAKAYYKVLFGDKKVVSVVVPIFNRADKLVEVLSSIENQGYEAKEIIVADDGSTDNTRLVVEEAKKQFRTPVLYLKTGDKLDYGLAKARNMGAIEALGDTLLFLDDRYALEENALENIIKGLDSKTFGFGLKIIKGKESTKTAFIENFAWINRKEFMNAGMFCERLTMYGGLSQETRTRFERQGYKMTQNKDVKCREIVKSSGGKNKKKEIWRAKHLLQKMYE